MKRPVEPRFQQPIRRLAKLAAFGATCLSTTAFASIDAFPSYVSFGQERVGSRSIPTYVTITNRGPNEVRSISVSHSCFSNFDVQSFSCFGPMRVGQSCSLTITYAPLNEGYHSCSISIYADGSFASVSASGNATERLLPLMVPLKAKASSAPAARQMPTAVPAVLPAR